MVDFVFRPLPSASISPAAGDPVKQSHVMLTFTKEIVSDLRSAYCHASTSQPATAATEYIYIKWLTKGEKVEAERLKQKNNWLNVPNFYDAMIDYSDNNPDATGKELDKYMSAMYTDNIIKLVQKKIDPVELIVSINSLNAYDAIHSDNIPMIKWGIEKYSNIIRQLIDEKDPCKFSSLLSDFEKLSRTTDKTSLLLPLYGSDALMNHVLNNPNLSINQQTILSYLHSHDLSSAVLFMTIHPMFENKTDGDFLNAILKLNNGFFPDYSRGLCMPICKWAGETRSTECINALFENTSSYLPPYHGRGDFTNYFIGTPSEALDFVNEIYFEKFIPMKQGQITQNTSPVELKDLLQKHDSGEKYIRSVDFLSLDVFDTNPETLKMLISRPEVPTVHIFNARGTCSNIQELHPRDQHNSNVIDIIDAELARRAGQ